MQMDYNQLDSDDRMHDNLFSNPWQSIALEFGGMAIGGAMERKGDSLVKRSKIAHRNQARIGKVPEFSMARRPGKLGLASKHLESARDFKSFGKSIKRLGHVFGMIGLAQVALEVTAGVLGTAGSFATSKSDIEAMRYKQMYDQDTYFDTRAAYTQRQRALQVIHNSRLSLKPALGNESGYLHQ